MPAPPRLGNLPDSSELKEELMIICRQPRGWWIAEKAHILMGLDCVRSYVTEGSDGSPQDEAVYADAVRSYLDVVVTQVPSPQYRKLLMVVLGLGSDRWRTVDWRSMSLQDRQEEAGRVFRKPDVARPSTVRAHQPKAVEALVKVILDDEATRRDKNGR